MIERDTIVIFIGLLLGALLCFFALTKNPVCLRSGIVAGISRRSGDAAAFRFVLVIGVVFTLLGSLTLFQSLIAKDPTFEDIGLNQRVEATSIGNAGRAD